MGRGAHEGASLAAARAQFPQTEIITPRTPGTFTTLAFPAMINTRTIKYDRFGNVEVTLTIPRDYVEAAGTFVELGDAIGTLLRVDLSKWTRQTEEADDGSE